MNAKNGKIRAGIIGMGNWGRYGHVPVLRLLPDFEIVAVASRRKEYAEQTPREFGIVHAFIDREKLINHPDTGSGCRYRNLS
jgi:predicted dehydrogenase